MRRPLARLGAGALLALYAAAAVARPPEPWSPEVVLWAVGAALVVAAWLGAHREAGHALRPRAKPLAFAGAAGAAALAGFALLPRWGLVESYLGSGFRRDIIATAFFVVATLVLLLFAIPHDEGAAES